MISLGSRLLCGPIFCCATANLVFGAMPQRLLVLLFEPGKDWD